MYARAAGALKGLRSVVELVATRQLECCLVLLETSPRRPLASPSQYADHRPLVEIIAQMAEWPGFAASVAKKVQRTIPSRLMSRPSDPLFI